MARKRQVRAASGRTILLVDDNPEYLETTRRVIQREGHDVSTAASASDALAFLGEHDVDLVLVDYLMPGMTGEEFVHEMREFRPDTQVVLQTGYASEHPPRELLQRMDIQGYHDKSEGTDKLLLWIDIGLKAAYSHQLLVKSRSGLRYILDATPALHRIQPLEDLLQGVLLQTCGLLGVTSGFVASVGQAQSDDAFVAMPRREGELSLRAATGRYRGTTRAEDVVDGAVLEQIRATLASTNVTAPACKGTLAPLLVGATVLGVVYFDRSLTQDWEAELVQLFANQAAVAIQNLSLYELAALDSLTGAMTRRFFDMALSRSLRAATRSGAPTGLVLIDVDRMKTLNDVYGHVFGDRALAAVGACLRRAVRATDIVGRIGGDELAVLLPETPREGVEVVVTRLRRALGALTLAAGEAHVRVSASVGAAVLGVGEAVETGKVDSAIESASRRLMAAADHAMYGHKHQRTPDAPEIAVVPWAA